MNLTLPIKTCGRAAVISMLMVGAAAGQAQTAPATDPAAPISVTPAQPDPDDRVVCRSEPVLGSIMRRTRQCHTVREWRLLREQNVAASQEAMARRSTLPGASGL